MFRVIDRKNSVIIWVWNMVGVSLVVVDRLIGEMSSFVMVNMKRILMIVSSGVEFFFLLVNGRNSRNVDFMMIVVSVNFIGVEG